MTYDNLKNRLGKFSISTEDLTERTDAVLKLFGSMIVLRSEFHFITNRLHYEAISPLFHSVKPEDVVVPLYSIKFDNDGVHSVRLMDIQPIAIEPQKVNFREFLG